jgi:predicted dinucleotide-binding enzyme
VPDVARELGDTVAGKVVLDATNPINADATGLATAERSGAEELQDRLAGAHVVKAFTTVFAANQADPVVDGTPLGDDEQAKSAVRQLSAEIGYRPIDAGGLEASRALEHMAFLNIALNVVNGWPWRSGWKLLGPTG